MDKFKELVHLVINDCPDPTKLGAIRLNKILWFSDIEFYRRTGKSISGSKYIRRNKGPVPALILKVLRELSSDGKINIKEPEAKYYPREYHSLEEPNSDLFSEIEQEIVKGLSKEICDNFSADEISDLSHDHVWEAASEGEEIPLSATLVSGDGDFRTEVTEWADSVVNLH